MPTSRNRPFDERAVLVLALALVACGSGNEGRIVAPAVPSSSRGFAPNFSAMDTEGRPVHLSDYLGKKTILLNFFATWCKPCVAEFPHLRALYEVNQGRGLIVIAVSVDGPETADNVASFAKRNCARFSTLLDADGHITGLYNPNRSVPLSVLIDKDGNVARVREGFSPGDEALIIEDVANVLDRGSKE